MTKLFMGEKEIDLLISRSSGSLRDNALFHMALATGFRVSDLVNLKVTDVVNAGRVVKSIKIRMVKTGKMVERALQDDFDLRDLVGRNGRLTCGCRVFFRSLTAGHAVGWFENFKPNRNRVCTDDGADLRVAARA